MSRNGPLPWMAGSFHFYGATRELVFARLLERMSIGFQVLPPGQVCKNASVPRTITIALIISCNSPIHPTAARERRLASRSELADSGEVGESPKWGSSLEAELAIRDPCTLPLPSHLLHQLGKSQVIAESTVLSELQSGCPWPSTSKRGISSLPCLWQPAQSPRRGMPQCRGERGKICWADSTKASASTACNPARDDRRGSRGTRCPQLR